ncbi:phosphonate C-P lyase system protein PhnG [Novispirillum itersonii]|uniref:phosphonate C-P lyase system protein PhnG n=1 Tax=Novispirillum itersonii TaxID=189 RepID=UPI0003723B6A|nr:phosphonate C-P lyase system protein PhnG [Novispirillum itersonii]
MSAAPSPLTAGQQARQRWIGILAEIPLPELEAAAAALPQQPGYTFLRAPEIGSALIRARSGGTGSRFNLGEMTLTRCAVRLDSGLTGFSWVAGRDRRHAELAAVFDALMQDPALSDSLDRTLITPAEQRRDAARHSMAAKAAATRVDFFTLVRGENE